MALSVALGMQGELIGSQLKAARKLRGVVTTDALAEKLSKPRFGAKVIGAIERNQRRAQPHEIAWLGEALDLQPSYFTDPPAPATPEVAVDLTAVLQEIKDQLLEQTRVLNEIKAAVTTEEAARRDLLDAAAVAGRVLRAGALRPVEAPESPTT